jgi:hypothetical protein
MPDIFDPEINAAILGISLGDVKDWLEKAEQHVLAPYTPQIQQWKDLLHKQHGCWCGPGHRCEEEQDKMDGCCHQHDLAYAQVGVSADSMWTAAAILKTRQADKDLVSCSTASVTEGEDDATVAYRAMLVEIFSTRAAIGDMLAAL